MPMTRPATTALALSLLALGPIGCAARDWIAGEDSAAMTPGDFVTLDNQPRNDGATPTATATNGPSPTIAQPDADAPAAAERASSADNVYTVDAMVGHINGEAVYARQILEPIEPQLAALGRQLDGQAFLEQATPLIEGRLRETLINDLLLGEADRDLTSRDRERVDALVQQERDELIRFFGQGSLARAKTMFAQDRGQPFDDYLKQYRDELTIRRFMDLQIRPKINVTPADIERYYYDRRDEFNRPARRAIRLIVATDSEAAETIKARLDAGESFAIVAGDAELNRYNAGGGGLFNAGEPITGDTVVSIEPVNDAIFTLEEGEHAGPISTVDRTFFVQLVAFEPEVRTELNDVMLDIDRQLRIEQFKFHSDRFRVDVIERGSYTKPEEMMPKLIEIAKGRFDSDHAE